MRKNKKTKKHPPRIKRGAKPRLSLGERIRSEPYLFALLLIGILLRFVDLGRQGLWIDEMCCWNDAHSSYTRIFSTAHWVVFLLERASVSLGGHNEYFLRLPSAFGGLLGLIFIYPLGLLLFNRRTALFALALLVFSPISIYYSQDANYYGLMMGLTITSLYFLFLFTKTHNPLWLLVYGTLAYVNYHVHPANILLIACQVIPLGFFLVFDSSLRQRARHIFGKLTENKLAFAGVAAVAILVLVGVGYKFFHFIYRMTIRSYGTVLAENLELSPRFFVKLAMDYGVAFQQYNKFILVLTFFLLIFFFRGLFYAAKKQRYFDLFVFLSWTFPFVAMYIKKMGHFYHCRYTAFIVPGFLLLSACGIDRLGNWLERRKSKRSVGAGLAMAMVFAIFATGMLPNLYRYYTGEKQDWKGAVLYLKKHLQPGEKVTSFIFCNDSSMRFYYKYFGMGQTPIVKLSGEFRGSAYSALFRLKRLCLQEPGVYFATSYTRYEDRRLWDWVKGYFDRAFYHPSLHPVEFNREGKEVILYKFKYTGAFVFPPYSYHFKPHKPQRIGGRFKKSLLFGAESLYQIAFDISDSSQNAEYLIEVRDSKGKGVSEKAKVEKRGNGALVSARLKIPEGIHIVSLMKKGAAGSDANIIGLSIAPEVAGAYHREAEDTDLYHPTPWKRIESIAGARCFTLERNNYALYDAVPFGKGGRFGFTLRALEDKPGPVIVEVALNWKPIGVLIYPKGNNTWSEESFPFSAPQGEHQISIHFLSQGALNSDRSKDTDACLDYFEIKPLKPGDKFPDIRIPTAERLIPPVSYIEQGFTNPASPLELAKGWQLQPQFKYTLATEETPEHNSAIRVTIPYDAKGFNLISPPFPVRGGALLYFSAWLKVEALNNHSANMMVIYLNAQNQMIARHIVNADGITGTTDWVRQVYFKSVPAGAVRAAIIFWVYPNSRRYATNEGFVWFDRLHFENPARPGKIR